MSPTSDEPSPSELMRAIEAIRSDIREMRAQYVQIAVQAERDRNTDLQIHGLEAEQVVVHKRIDRIDERITTNFRLVLAGFIYPLAVAVVVYLLLTGAHS